MPTMQTRNPVSSANLMGHPLHPILITLPIGLFVATFLFDLIFWQTGNAAFATGALWLLGAGLIAAALAAVTGLIDFLGDRRIRALGDAWQHAIGNVILVLIQLFSFLSALSLRDERSRAVRAEPLAHCRSHHAVHRLERRRTALPPPCRGLRRKVSAEARRALVLNRWPGNVRELENTLHRAVLLAGGDEIGINGIGGGDLCRHGGGDGDARAGRPHRRRRRARPDPGDAQARQPHPRCQHPRHLDPHAPQQAQRICRRRRADPAAGQRRGAAGGVDLDRHATRAHRARYEYSALVQASAGT
jgi:uncharacterized membrane protein